MGLEDTHFYRRNDPEKILQNAEAMRADPFEAMARAVPLTGILPFMQDKALMSEIKGASWPIDQEVCEQIAVIHHMGAEQIARISIYHREGGSDPRAGQGESIH